MKTILLVEDTTSLAEEIADVLRMENFNVVVANNGEQALLYLEQNLPELIITDLLMPGIDGFSLIEKVRSDTRFNQIPIIVLSAKTDEDTYHRLASSEVHEFIKKPCKPQNLLKSIHSALQ